MGWTLLRHKELDKHILGAHAPYAQHGKGVISTTSQSKTERLIQTGKFLAIIWHTSYVT